MSMSVHSNFDQDSDIPLYELQVTSHPDQKEEILRELENAWYFLSNDQNTGPSKLEQDFLLEVLFCENRAHLRLKHSCILQ